MKLAELAGLGARCRQGPASRECRRGPGGPGHSGCRGGGLGGPGRCGGGAGACRGSLYVKPITQLHPGLCAGRTNGSRYASSAHAAVASTGFINFSMAFLLSLK